MCCEWRARIHWHAGVRSSCDCLGACASLPWMGNRNTIASKSDSCCREYVSQWNLITPRHSHGSYSRHHFGCRDKSGPNIPRQQWFLFWVLCWSCIRFIFTPQTLHQCHTISVKGWLSLIVRNSFKLNMISFEGVWMCCVVHFFLHLNLSWSAVGYTCTCCSEHPLTCSMLPLVWRVPQK